MQYANDDFCAMVWKHQREARIMREDEAPADGHLYFVYLSRLWAACESRGLSPFDPSVFGDYVECDDDFEPKSDAEWGATLLALMADAEARGFFRAWVNAQEEGEIEARFERLDQAQCERWIRGI